MEVPIWVQSKGQTELFKSYSYSVVPCAKQNLKKKQLKKCKYECTVNAIP